MTKLFKENNIYKIFEASLIVKGLDGVLQIIGGIILLWVSPAAISRVITALTQHELVEDRRDIIANYLVKFAQHFSANTKLFAAVFLLSHGLIKIFIVINLLKNKLWAYPTAITVFAAFGLYQIYRFSYSHAISLVVLTVLDILIIWLTGHEYKKAKLHLPLNN